MKTVRNILTIILTASILIACNRQKCSDKCIEIKTISNFLNSTPELKKIVNSIEKGNRVESSHIGYAGSPSSQWKRYEQLKKIATSDQLVALTEHKNPAVRCYAFQALAASHSDKTFEVLLKHLNDTTVVETQFGCIVTEILTGDYFIDVLTPDYIETDVYKLNTTERIFLDSILINDKSIKLFAKSIVLKYLGPTVENYVRIRQLVSEERDEFALQTLAKYKKQTDRELIASFFKNDDTQFSAISAVREFPDDYFYPFVKKVFEQEWEKERYDYDKWKKCYQALANYPSIETLELFDKTVKCKDKFRYNTLCTYLLVAITKYQNKLYEPIKASIKLDEFRMRKVNEEIENNY